VYVWNSSDLSAQGAEIVSEGQPNSLWRKVFRHKKIYLPNERNQAFDAHLRSQPNSFALSMNGYSSITPAMRDQYGIDAGAYEAACEALLKAVIGRVRKKFPSANIVVTDGASAMGIDEATMKAADALGITTLGFSCPDFMMYVIDDERPVYVSKSVEEYAENYIRPLHLLITTGGRQHSLHSDITESIKHGVRIHFVNVISGVASVPVPATVSNGNGGRKVENACAAFGELISFTPIGYREAETTFDADDWFEAIVVDVSSVAINECRRRMPVTHRFPV
jgi:hypothetical protein